jgi:nucleoid-associated protein YgaU
MAFPQLGPFGRIVEDFTKSLNDIFGRANPGGSGKVALVNKDKYLPGFDATKWTGNNTRSGEQRLRYGFRKVSLTQLNSAVSGGPGSLLGAPTYYLDIPPQAISQKENFATNIQATRRGVIVETEGIVFKDIVIQGTTGVFPGKRDSFGGAQAQNPFSDGQVNLKKLTEPPSRKGGVSTEGRSGASTNVTGYEEFLSLRAFFVQYSEEKVQARGDLFLVFINEKDQQALLVEPLEFVMERNSKAPMQYQYRIVLKCIGVLDSALESAVKSKDTPDSLLNQIANVSANASAAINQFRAAVGATNRLVQAISQEIDKTFINPLRLLGAALKDVSEARKNVLTSSSALRRNLNESLLSIEEARFDKTVENMIKDPTLVASVRETTSGGFVASSGIVSQGKLSERGVTDTTTSNKLLSDAQAENFIRGSVNALEQSAQEPLPKAYVQGLRDDAQKLADDIADAVNLGNADYDQIQNRTPTIIANPLKVATSNEYLLLGATQKLVAALDQVLATNGLFQQDIEADFEERQSLLKDIVDFQAPSTVREVVIQQNDTLEKIALRAYGDVLRWPDLAILNNLKYPYIGTVKADGVKIPGDKILIGNN